MGMATTSHRRLPTITLVRLVALHALNVGTTSELCPLRKMTLTRIPSNTHLWALQPPVAATASVTRPKDQARISPSGGALMMTAFVSLFAFFASTTRISILCTLCRTSPCPHHVWLVILPSFVLLLPEHLDVRGAFVRQSRVSLHCHTDINLYINRLEDSTHVDGMASTGLRPVEVD